MSALQQRTGWFCCNCQLPESECQCTGKPVITKGDDPPLWERDEPTIEDLLTMNEAAEQDFYASRSISDAFAEQWRPDVY